jgi:uncharacterized membrane protein YphA (DoxX/SURF4 family)
MNKRIEWILRIAVAGEFIGHGIFGLQAKATWVGWAQQLLGVSVETATTLIILVGVMDVALGILVLIKPIRPIVLFMALWGLWTALLRPIVGEPFADFVERWANWGAPLALYYLLKQR